MANTGLVLEETKEILLFLATAGVVVPLFRRFKISPVIGFLAAGVLLGPHGIGGFSDHPWFDNFQLGNTQKIAQIAEFGVVFLLFMIGLELSYERLSRMRKLVFGLGSAQVVFSTVILGECAVLIFGLQQGPALIVGAALALSSTAIVIPVLAERKRLSTTTGRAAFSVLLFQDLMVAPLLFAVSMAGSKGSVSSIDMFYNFLPALGVIAILVFGGRVLVRPLFHQVALTRSTEFFMATCLFVVIGTGVISAWSGLSMALGAFIAGLLLSETEYRREIEATLEPFKGLLLGLFFVSIGAELDVMLVISKPTWIILTALGLIIVKSAILFALSSSAGLSRPASAELALLLGPGGEFAFVMISAAIAKAVLPADIGAIIILSVTFSMVMIPVLASFAANQREPDPRASILEYVSAPPTRGREGQVIVIGFGRVGQLICELLTFHNVEFIAVDGDLKVVSKKRSMFPNLYWGDATKETFLKACGLEDASAVIVTIDQAHEADQVVELVRKVRSEITIVSRARDAQHAARLYRLGASDVIPETIEASLQLASAALRDIGVPEEAILASIKGKRDDYQKFLQSESEQESGHAFKFSKRVS